MKLFRDIQRCNDLLMKAHADELTIAEIITVIKQSDLCGFVKYYAYQYLLILESNNASTEETLTNLLTLRPAKRRARREAQDCYAEMRKQFMRLPASDNAHFIKLLLLFSDYYSVSPLADEAAAWSESLNSSWIYNTAAFVVNACRAMVNLALENPVKTSLLFLFACAICANGENKRPDKEVAFSDEYAPDYRYPSTDISEFITQSTQPELAELISLKMKVHADIPESEIPAVTQACKNAELIVAKAAMREHHGHIVRVLSNPKFKAIYCANQYISNGLNFNGVFQAHAHVVSLDVSKSHDTQLAAITHEFMHADAYYRHSNSLCYISNPTSRISPTPDVTNNAVAVWEKAFQQGNAHVTTFYELWLKQQSGEPLSKTQYAALSNYQAACNEITLATRYLVSKDYARYTEFQALLTTHQHHGSIIAEFTEEGRWLGYFKLLTMSKYVNGQFRYRLQATHPAQTLFMQAVITDADLQNEPYASLDPEARLGEREAFTLMHLTPKAAQTFYPEAYALRQQSITKCTTPMQQGADYQKRIRVGLFFAKPAPVISQELAEDINHESSEPLQMI